VATKEVNEKARDIAYNHLVAVSNKMKAGGISSERVSMTWKEHLARPWPHSVNALQW